MSHAAWRGVLGLGLGCLAIGTVACGKRARAPLEPARLPSALLQFAAPPQTLTYERKRVVGAIGLPADPVKERWSQVSVDAKAIVYEARIGIDRDGASRVARRFRYTMDGIALVAEGPVEEGGPVLDAWSPPAVILPAEPLSAAPWEATHRVGEREVTRSCEIIMTSDQCDSDGIIVVCDAVWPDFRLVTRDHFCRGVGWSGYESLVVHDARPAVRTWTEGLQRLD